MSKLLLLLGVCWICCSGIVYSSCESQEELSPDADSLSEVTYTTSTEIITNPERGFYKHLSCNLGEESPLQPGSVQSLRENGYTLVLRIYYLKNYRDRELDEIALETLEKDMDVLRSSGVKCILRLAYSQSPEEPDAPLSVIQSHLDQLKPWFERNYDVIAVMQAGLIGAWGEWYYTSNNLNTQAAQATVLNKILEVLPGDRMVQVRTPKYKMDYVQNANPLTSEEAFTGTKKSRVGHHNDCFLASTTDYGTYQNVDSEKKYLNIDAQYVPVGGETCPPTDIEPADCVKAQAEMRNLRWTYLNEDYYRGVNDRWVDEGCMDNIRRELGYRFVLRSGAYSPEVSPGHTLTVQLMIENHGYASLFNPRLIELILVHEDSNARFLLRLSEDPRFWKPGVKSELYVTAGIPSDMPMGMYQMYLSLPDPMPGLYGNPDFSIQLANKGSWQKDNGYNSLNMPVRISKTGTTLPYGGDQVFQSE